MPVSVEDTDYIIMHKILKSITSSDPDIIRKTFLTDDIDSDPTCHVDADRHPMHELPRPMPLIFSPISTVGQNAPLPVHFPPLKILSPIANAFVPTAPVNACAPMSVENAKILSFIENMATNTQDATRTSISEIYTIFTSFQSWEDTYTYECQQVDGTFITKSLNDWRLESSVLNKAAIRRMYTLMSVQLRLSIEQLTAVWHQIRSTLSALSTDSSMLPSLSLAFPDENEPPSTETLTISSVIILENLEKIIVMIGQIVPQPPSLDIVQERIDSLRTCISETLEGLNVLITFCRQTKSRIDSEFYFYMEKFVIGKN